MYDASNCEYFGRHFNDKGECRINYSHCHNCNRHSACRKKREETIRLVVKGMAEAGLFGVNRLTISERIHH